MTGKKLILVGLQDRETADLFLRDIYYGLKQEGVEVTHTPYSRDLYTPNTEIRFVGERDFRYLDGIRAYAIFGAPKYRRMLEPFLRINGEMPTIGLLDYVLDIERREKIFEIKPICRFTYNKLEIDNRLRNLVSDTASNLSMGLITAAQAKLDLEKELYKEMDKKIYEEIKKTLMEETIMPTATSMYYMHHNYLRDLGMECIITKPETKPVVPEIKTVHFSGPVTVVLWKDGTKTIVRCKDGEIPDPEKGLAMAIAKKTLGTNKSHSNYYDIFKKYVPKPEPKEDE